MESPRCNCPCMAVVSRSRVTSATPLVRSRIEKDVSRTNSQRLNWPKPLLGSSRKSVASRMTNDPPPTVLFLHSAFFILHSSTASIELIFLTPIMMFNLILQIRQRILHGLDKIPTTGCQAAEIDDRLALGPIVRHCQNFAVRLEAMRGALDHLVGRLSRAGKENFHFGGGGGD